MSETMSPSSWSTPTSSAASLISPESENHEARKSDPPANPPPTNPPLAYKDEKFLDSDEARPIRILAEYLHPLRMFLPHADTRDDRVLRIGENYSGRPARTLLPGCARAGATDHGLVEGSSLECSPLRRLLGRRSRYHGGGKSRRVGSGRKDDRAEHRIAARAAAQSVHHARAIFSVSLFFHAQVVVRASRAGAGGFSRRLRHARRNDGDTDPAANAKTGSPDHGAALRIAILEGDHQLRRAGAARHDQSRGSQTVQLCRRSSRGASHAAERAPRAT